MGKCSARESHRGNKDNSPQRKETRKKKLYWQTTFGQVEIEEVVMKVHQERIRPFSISAKVKCRAYSQRLQRAIVDFGADASFQQAQKKLLEHYRIEIPVSTIQSIVKNHAKDIFEFIENQNYEEGTAKQIVALLDGSMIPIVDTGNEGDKRKTRKVRWQEARLCFARGARSITPVFYATLGNVERTGDLLYRAALRLGCGPKTRVHGLGDGAKWIEEQMTRVFGKQVKYLVDFYHVSGYLAQAAEHSWTSQKEEWRREQQELLKQSKHEEVLKTLLLRLPPDWKETKEKKSKETEKASPETAVEKCYRYIDNRKQNLDYKYALDNDLPIGSGEIESAHRYVIQERLKIAGAWWKPETAEYMLALRTLKANEDWERYWRHVRAA